MRWLLEGQQGTRVSGPGLADPCSAQEPGPFYDHPHRVFIQKAKGKDQKIRSQSPGGPTPTPLQATPSRLLGEARGKTRPRGSAPISGSVQRLLLASESQLRPSSPPPPSRAGTGTALSVLIDSKNADSVQLGQLGDEHTHQGHGVEDEMDLVVLGVEAGEEVPAEPKVAKRSRLAKDHTLPPPLPAQKT